MNHFDDIKREYASAAKALGLEVPVGADKHEIERVAARVDLPMCVALKQFFSWMGMDYNGVLRGTDCFLVNFLNNVEWLPEFFAEMNVTWVGPQPVCFYSHQGYIAFWYDATSVEDDPPLWFLADDGRHNVPSKVGTVSSVLSDEVRGRMAARRSWHSRDRDGAK